MPSRHTIGSDSGCTIHEVMKLDVVIAKDAGAGCLAPQIRRDERCDDGVLEVLFEVQDVVGNSQLRGHTSSVPEVVERTAAAVIAPKLHRETDDLFTALLQ